MEHLLKYRICVVIFLIVGFTACGGGGSSSAVNPTAGAEATPTITPTVQSTTNVTPAPSATPTPAATVTPTAIPISTPSPTPTAEPIPVVENPQTRKTYFFGHSLINWALSEVYHDPAGGATTVPNWLALMAEAAGNGFSVSGRFGFLRDYNNFGPIPQWGFDDAESAWDDTNYQWPSDEDSNAGVISDEKLIHNSELFRSIGFDSVVITAGNFIQWQGAGEAYPDSNSGRSPLGETIALIDWIQTYAPDATIFIYENWPDSASIWSAFPPNDTELSNYYAYTTQESEGGFHAWWLDYFEQLKQARPNAKLKLIPVGPVLAELLTSSLLSDIPVTDLYEDDAPHGMPTVYYLASLVTYGALYHSLPPETFFPGTEVNSAIVTHHSAIREQVWDSLINFNDNDGNSLVFESLPMQQ